VSGRDLVLAQGIAAARAGDRQAARRLLAEAARRDPGSELAWLWLSSVLDTTQGRSYCLQKALEINPDNKLTRRGLEALAGTRATRTMIVQAMAPEPGDVEQARPARPAPPPETAASRRGMQAVVEARAARAVVAPARTPEPGDTGEDRRPGRTLPPAASAPRPDFKAQAEARRARGLEVSPLGPKASLTGAVDLVRLAPPPADTAVPRRAPAARRKRRPGRRQVMSSSRFWQILVYCLGITLVSMVGVLLYRSTLGSTAPADTRLFGATFTEGGAVPHATLRPTFTATATHTATLTPSPQPSATASATPTLAPTATPTSLPTSTATSTPVPQPTPRRATAVPALVSAAMPPATAKAEPAPRPTLPPCSWDPRLDALGVRVEPVGVREGQTYWRLVEARWADEKQSAGKHSIYVEVLDLQGRRAMGQTVVVQWADGSVALPVVDRPAPDWGVDFAMYNCLGSYAVSVGGGPGDRVVGLGLGTPETPNFTVHTSFYLVFRMAQR
jgi:hypothetical protein